MPAFRDHGTDRRAAALPKTSCSEGGDWAEFTPCLTNNGEGGGSFPGVHLHKIDRGGRSILQGRSGFCNKMCCSHANSIWSQPPSGPSNNLPAHSLLPLLPVLACIVVHHNGQARGATRVAVLMGFRQVDNSLVTAHRLRRDTPPTTSKLG